MTSESLSSEDIYKALALSKTVIQKSIITFVLSTSFKKEILVELTIKDFLEACGRNIDDENALGELLNENPLEILPCWVLDDLPNKLIFNSYEATFYLFLYLKSRPSITDYDEPLFANVRGNRVAKYAPNTIRDMISNASQDTNFRQTSLINTFKEACANFVLDDEVKKLFLGESDEYDSKDEILNALRDNLFKERLIDSYEVLMPHVTAGYFMYEHLSQYVALDTNVDDYGIKIKNYFDNSFNSVIIAKFSRQNKVKLLGHAISLARTGIENGEYVESNSYYDKILKKAAAFVLYRKLEDSLGQDSYSQRNFDDVSPTEPDERIDLIYDCIVKARIKYYFNLDDEMIKDAIGTQLAVHGNVMGDFNYGIFEEILFDSIYYLIDNN